MNIKSFTIFTSIIAAIVSYWHFTEPGWVMFMYEIIKDIAYYIDEQQHPIIGIWLYANIDII